MEENKSAYDHLREKATDTNEAQDGDSLFATVKDFMGRFKTSTYMLQDGLTIEYRALLPIDFQTFRGSSLSAQMIEDGFTLNKTQNAKTREQYAESLPRLVRSQLMVEAAKDAIIHAAVNPRFSGLPKDRCPADKASIDDLSPTEILVFNDAIYQLSGGDLAEERFRGTSQADDVEGQITTDAGSESEHVDGSIDREGV